MWRRGAAAWLVILIGCGDDAGSTSATSSSTAGETTGAATTGSASTSGGGTGGSACDESGQVDASPPIGTWTDLAPLAGGARQETAVVALGGKIYLLGGFTLGGLSAAVEIYDPTTDTWSDAPPLPTEMHHANAAVVGDTLYVLGFLETGAFLANGAGFAYTEASGVWTPVAAMPAGTERGSGATAVVGSKVVVAGGFRGGAVADASIYDPATDTWETLPALPVARDHGAGASYGGIFYAIGGRMTDIGAFEPAVFAFDPAVGMWCAKEPLPTPRGGIAAAVVGDRIVVVGGEGSSGENGVFTEVEAFEPATNTWFTLTPLSVGRHGTGAATIDGVFYLPGGADQEAFGAVATVSKLTL
ncbi:MAG: kelch repeat-containing protein [Polyangiaceae bacterium]|nr:kelch repeat-containing protein [Polyangiaceae bacterium]